MELGVGEALTSFLDENGVPAMAQRTSIICPQSLMGAASDTTRRNLMARDGMSKYDQAYDGESAYEVLTEQMQQAAEAEKLAAERAQLEKDKEAFEAQKAKEEAAARKQKEKQEEDARKKKEKEEAAALKKKEQESERRKNQIEKQLINTGMQVLKRGILNTLFK
jgi:hypothetical protein